MTCPRCGQQPMAITCSWFTSEDICVQCQIEERLAPNYEKARQVERDAVLAGNYRFPGIGLAPEDEAALTAAREARS